MSMRRRRASSYYTTRRSYYNTRRQPRRRRRGSSPWPRLFYGVAVLAGGIAGAWHYHKTAEVSPQPAVAQGPTATDDVTLQLVAPTPVVPEAPWDAPQQATEQNAVVETPKAPRASLDSASSPPNLAAAFEPLTIKPSLKPAETTREKSSFTPLAEQSDEQELADLESTGDLQHVDEHDATPAAGESPDDAAETTEDAAETSEDAAEPAEEAETIKPADRPHSSTANSTPRAVEVARPQQHRVVDGDTLAGLAAKYLGNADRWRVIYDANRSSLSSSEWLPVGVLLTIPRVEPTGSGAHSTSTEMVPVPTNLLYPDVKN